MRLTTLDSSEVLVLRLLVHAAEAVADWVAPAENRTLHMRAIMSASANPEPVTSS
jgi:hypothetical protein